MRKRILLYIIVIISMILCTPSVLFLVNNKTVDGFDSYYTYTLEKHASESDGLIAGIIIIGLLLIFSIVYLIIIKKEEKIFESRKEIFLSIGVVSFIFMLILPYLSSDIYYYIGNSWLSSKYKQNPYYTTVENLQNEGINDEILNNTGYWKNTTSVYGPLWNMIGTFLVTFSFGNLTIALFIFKIASFVVHMMNCLLIYKITKSNKYVLFYGLNPLVLIELLSNVHNDIYLILFILLALYFLIEKKNTDITLVLLALSICIKYSTVLIVPFVLIYLYKDKTIGKRIVNCIVGGLLIIAIVLVLYLPYVRDFSIFTNMLVQGSKYSQSLITIFLENANQELFNKINSLLIPFFAIIYISTVGILLVNRNLNLNNILRCYNIMMLIFIFIVLTSFQKWYILWLLPTIMWQENNMKKFITYLSITALVPSMGYFITGTDAYMLGVGYSMKIIILSITLLILNILINKVVKVCKNKLIKRVNN